ncbi:hypothetical protein J4468_00225 [Candidatus Woesearchaeota archaeon]|nr:hypothetical protein [Candidatus Woesearchaeota archaeon]
MARKKKSSLLWEIIKLFFRGIWFILSGIVKLISKFFGYLNRKISERAKSNKLNNNPIYTMPSYFKPFDVIKEITGKYSTFENKLYKESIIALIFGKRGSGKSALGFKILENINNKTKRKCYILGIEQSLVPKWINPIGDITNAPDNSIVLVDEGAVSFGSRDSMSSKNKELTKILAIARHKDLTLIFITQNTGLIDKNVLKLVDILLVKEGSLLQTQMERSEIKKFYEKANASFKSIKGDKKPYTYIIDSDFEGVVSFDLPSFWSTKLSKNKVI